MSVHHSWLEEITDFLDQEANCWCGYRQCLARATEADIFRALGLEFIRPEDREI
jgi:hypothetical protein